MKVGGANSADISIVVDALELLYGVPEIEVYVLATGDSDFVPLIQKLRAKGKLVVGAAPARKETRPAYESSFDRFERLLEAGEEAPKPRPGGQASREAKRNGPSALTVENARKALGAILRDGPKDVGELGSLLRDALPGFDQRAIGFRRLSDMLRAQSDILSLVTDGTQLRVALVGVPAAPPSRPAEGGGLRADVQPKPAHGPTLEGSAWTLLRDHLLAVLYAGEPRPRMNDEELIEAMCALAKKTNGALLPGFSLEHLLARYPACFQRTDEGMVTPLVALADAYRLRLGRVWEPLPRDVLRKALALVPTVLQDGEPVMVADVTVRLAEAANGELTQAQTRAVVRLISRAEGWAPAEPDAADRARVRPRSWVLDPAAAESKLDEAALMRMGPFLPVDPQSMAAALGRDDALAPPAPAPEPAPPAGPQPTPAEGSTCL
jgi:hypothetical protein